MSTTTQTLPMKTDDYVRMRTMATGLLLFMALLFVVAVFEQEAHPSFTWLRAFAEAAMVGAIADWYAVTALFRRPLGLPIPPHGHHPREYGAHCLQYRESHATEAGHAGRDRQVGRLLAHP